MRITKGIYPCIDGYGSPEHIEPSSPPAINQCQDIIQYAIKISNACYRLAHLHIDDNSAQNTSVNCARLLRLQNHSVITHAKKIYNTPLDDRIVDSKGPEQTSFRPAPYRRKKVIDPENPGKMISRTTLHLRQKVVDPANEGELVSRGALYKRKKVEDPHNPGKVISRGAFFQRKKSLTL